MYQYSPTEDINVTLWKGGLRLLEHDDGDCIVEDALAKNDAVQLRIDLELIEYCKLLRQPESAFILCQTANIHATHDRHGISRGEGRAEDETLDYAERETFQAKEGPDVDQNAGWDTKSANALLAISSKWHG